MLFGIEWSARVSIDAEYLYHGSDPTREPRLTFPKAPQLNKITKQSVLTTGLSIPRYLAVSWFVSGTLAAPTHLLCTCFSQSTWCASSAPPCRIRTSQAHLYMPSALWHWKWAEFWTYMRAGILLKWLSHFKFSSRTQEWFLSKWQTQASLMILISKDKAVSCRIVRLLLVW